MEYTGNVVNHVKSLLVRELGKYLILKFSLLEITPASVKYRAMCLIVDSLALLANLVKLWTFQTLGNSIYNTYSDNGDEYLGLRRPTFMPFRVIILSTMASKLFSPFRPSC